MDKISILHALIDSLLVLRQREHGVTLTQASEITRKTKTRGCKRSAGGLVPIKHVQINQRNDLLVTKQTFLSNEKRVRYLERGWGRRRLRIWVERWEKQRFSLTRWREKNKQLNSCNSRCVNVRSGLPAGGCPALSTGASFAPLLDSCCTIF